MGSSQVHDPDKHGSYIGLRAIGWFVADNDPRSPACPIHHPEHDDMIASTAVIQYVLEHHYDTFLSLDAQHRLTELQQPPPFLPSSQPPPQSLPLPPHFVRRAPSITPMTINPAETWAEAARRYVKENGG